ncbi:hypothetical protein AZZ82_003610 [Klebsiella aerogenes]|nr:hypothetical protein AZZ82_003610 [Klebsiella aerogenes]
MTPNISITLNTPHVTIERYSELTGLPVDAINDILADSRLPRTACVRIRSARR